jgi:hypothetical protein
MALTWDFKNGKRPLPAGCLVAGRGDDVPAADAPGLGGGVEPHLMLGAAVPDPAAGELPAGPVRALPPPVRGAGDVAALGPIPPVGEHTGAILGELGYTDAEVAALRDARVV